MFWWHRDPRPATVGLFWDWGGRDAVPFVPVGPGPVLPAPPPPPRSFAVAPQVYPAPVSLGLTGCSPSIRSRAAAALASKPGAGVGGSSWRGFGDGGFLRRAQGLRRPELLSIPVLALHPVLWGGGFRLPPSAAREELGPEEDGRALARQSRRARAMCGRR